VPPSLTQTHTQTAFDCLYYRLSQLSYICTTDDESGIPYQLQCQVAHNWLPILFRKPNSRTFQGLSRYALKIFEDHRNIIKLRNKAQDFPGLEKLKKFSTFRNLKDPWKSNTYNSHTRKAM